MSQRSEWGGTWVALVTPFAGDAVDVEGLRRLVAYCIEGGVDGLVPCGTTGEAATLSESEFREVVGATLAEAAGRVPVVAGTGTNATAATIERTALARDLGCAGALVVSPYYNKPTQAGLEAHYRAIVQELPGFPLVLYNVPSRTAGNLAAETVERLAVLPEVVAIKEASGDLVQVQEILRRCEGRLAVVSGDDPLSLPIYALGGHGVVSVTGNVAPAEMSAIWNAYAAGRVQDAARAQRRLLPLMRALFVETNPGPVKAAVELLGIASGEPRLPLVAASPETRDRVRAELAELSLLTHV